MRSLVLALQKATSVTNRKAIPTLLESLRHLYVDAGLPSWALEGAEKVFSAIAKLAHVDHQEDGESELSVYGFYHISSDDGFSVRRWRFLETWDEAVRHAQRAKRSFNVLFEYLLQRHGGFRNRDQSSPEWLRTWQSFQKRYSLLWFVGLATKWLKYHLPAMFAKVACQELPAALADETPGMFLGGIGYVFLRHLVHSGRSDVSYSILMAKKGLPPVHSMELTAAIDDCVRSLSSERRLRLVSTYNTRRQQLDSIPRDSVGYGDVLDQSTDELHHPVVERMDLDLRGRSRPLKLNHYRVLPYRERLHFLIEEVRRTCMELFEPVSSSLVRRGHGLGIPSISAHIESGRPDGGAYGQLSRDFRNLWESTTSNVCGRLYCPVLDDYLPMEVSSSVGYCRDTCSPYRDSPTLGRVVDDQNEHIEQHWSHEKRVIELWWALLKGKSLQEPNVVSPVALPEPLKVRVITKGPAIRYYLGKVIQRLTWGVLKNHPTFRAIGEPLTLEFLQERLRDIDTTEHYLSGDYKSATDLLHPDLSAIASFEIGQWLCLDDIYQRLYVDGLVNSQVENPRDHLEPVVPQRWGQLMGSPLSFPILCLVNAAINRYFLEMSYGRSFSLEECPMAINGDDIVMRCKIDSYEAWKMIVDDAGLVPSIGKNYVSRDFFVINSTYYRHKGTTLTGDPIFEKVPYLNLALVTPSIEKMDLVRPNLLDPKIKDLSQLSWKACEGFEPMEQDWLMSKFLGWEDVKSLLSRVPRGASYFVSKALGGVGIKATRDGLLTPEQIGYYSRAADQIGETPTSTLQRNIGGGADWCLMDTVPSALLWEDWLHRGQYSDLPMPSSLDLLSAYAGDVEPREINTRIDEKTRVRVSICDKTLFRKPECSWPTHILCDWPWEWATVRDYGQSDRPYVSFCDEN